MGAERLNGTATEWWRSAIDARWERETLPARHHYVERLGIAGGLSGHYEALLALAA